MANVGARQRRRPVRDAPFSPSEWIVGKQEVDRISTEKSASHLPTSEWRVIRPELSAPGVKGFTNGNRWQR